MATLLPAVDVVELGRRSLEKTLPQSLYTRSNELPLVLIIPQIEGFGGDVGVGFVEFGEQG